ncbi:iron transporter [Massarina eburnea CBS 473.64]|uniref:Solute carrier family 40 member n=1 Tax=Massarina eburnea CBS 473.64 TaxID=1395130 RepID=A0A6A6RWC5_9PLEO|nr:iron transporter [Massarina eburnea CBS 473.64]
MDASPSSSAPPSPQPDNSLTNDTTQDAQSTPDRSVLWKLYLSHTLSTWNARTFEFGAVIFLARIFPGTLFYASCYALFRSFAATLFSSYIGTLVDTRSRLWAVRQSIIYQRFPVASSCLILLVLLKSTEARFQTIGWFGLCVALACIEKLAFVGNTVAVERDWAVVIAGVLNVKREDLNSGMRRIDLVCKLVAPLGISLVDGYSTKVAIWVVFGQNALSIMFEYFAIAQVYNAVPELAQRKTSEPISATSTEAQTTSEPRSFLEPWKSYIHNPAFLASFSLSLLYLTVLSFASQMTTYLLTLSYTSIHISLFRLITVVVELSATCAAPMLIKRIGAVRSGLWFINEQLLSVVLAIGLFTLAQGEGKIAGGALVVGVTLSRLGLWGFDLSVQYLVQENTPEATRGSFSAIEASVQSFFELLSYATTMVFAKPEQFKYPVYISAGAISISAICFASFVRQKRGHLLHTSRCLERKAKGRYEILPTIEEETQLDDVAPATTST